MGAAPVLCVVMASASSFFPSTPALQLLVSLLNGITSDSFPLMLAKILQSLGGSPGAPFFSKEEEAQLVAYLGLKSEAAAEAGGGAPLQQQPAAALSSSQQRTRCALWWRAAPTCWRLQPSTT